MSVPAVILPAIQRSDMDCGMICLAMLADRPYQEVRDEALKAIPNLHTRGMFASELRRIGQRLGLRMVKRVAWTDDEVGVLDVTLPRGGRHFVVFFQGILINPADGLVWDASAYASTRRASYRALYAVEER